MRLISSCSIYTDPGTPSSSKTERHPTTKLPPILHYSASEPYTKYEMCLLFASLHSPPLAHSHIVPDAEDPIIPPGGVGRPKDCHLSTAVIEAELGMELETQLFEEWWRAELGKDLNANA